MDTKGPKMVQGDFTPAALRVQHRKEVAIIRQVRRGGRRQTT
jgi:hypothetical protein